MLDSQTRRLIEGGIQLRDIANPPNLHSFPTRALPISPVGDLIRPVGPVSNCIVMTHDEYARFTNLQADRRRNKIRRDHVSSEVTDLWEMAPMETCSSRLHPKRRPIIEQQRDDTQ